MTLARWRCCVDHALCHVDECHFHRLPAPNVLYHEPQFKGRIV